MKAPAKQRHLLLPLADDTHARLKSLAAADGLPIYSIVIALITIYTEGGLAPRERLRLMELATTLVEERTKERRK